MIIRIFYKLTFPISKNNASSILYIISSSIIYSSVFKTALRTSNILLIFIWAIIAFHAYMSHFFCIENVSFWYFPDFSFLSNEKFFIYCIYFWQFNVHKLILYYTNLVLSELSCSLSIKAVENILASVFICLNLSCFCCSFLLNFFNS